MVERWLQRTRQALQTDTGPDIRLLLHQTAGILHAGRGRLHEALEELGAAEDLGSQLADSQALASRTTRWLPATQARLGMTGEARAFITALDDERVWYRYHHLFAEMLKSRLEQTQPTIVAALHQRASTWYEQQDLLAEAVQHALAAPDLERTARLMAHRACSSSCSIHRRL